MELYDEQKAVEFQQKLAQNWIKSTLDYEAIYKNSKELYLDLFNWFDISSMPYPIEKRIALLKGGINHFEQLEKYEIAGDIQKQIDDMWDGKLFDSTGYAFIPQTLKQAAKKCHFLMEYEGAF